MLQDTIEFLEDKNLEWTKFKESIFAFEIVVGCRRFLEIENKLESEKNYQTIFQILRELVIAYTHIAQFFVPPVNKRKALAESIETRTANLKLHAE